MPHKVTFLSSYVDPDIVGLISSVDVNLGDKLSPERLVLLQDDPDGPGELSVACPPENAIHVLSHRVCWRQC